MTADPDNVRDEGQRARAGVGGRSGTEHDDLAITLADLARSLQEEKDTSTVLERIVRAAIDLVPGCDEGSISMVTDRRRVESQVPSGALPRQVDALQTQTGQGPCLDSVYTRRRSGSPICAPSSVGPSSPVGRASWAVTLPARVTTLPKASTSCRDGSSQHCPDSTCGPVLRASASTRVTPLKALKAGQERTRHPRRAPGRTLREKC